MQEIKMMKVIDLFAGVGGMSAGFKKAGYDIVLANEFDKTIAKSYEKNHPGTKMIAKDIKELDTELDEYAGKIDVIIGGPPCQGFSMAGARIREQWVRDVNRIRQETICLETISKWFKK